MNPTIVPRRQFIKLGALAAGAAVTPSDAFAAPAFELPPLPYPADALEPHIGGRTMEIHHGKHHAGYVRKLNEALADGDAAEKEALGRLLTNLPEIADDAVRTKVRQNAGGHWNHSFFWEGLAPADKAGSPGGALKSAIDESFGSVDAFKEEFAGAATTQFGSGWAWLVVKGGKLRVVNTANQDNPLMVGIVPDSDTGSPVIGLDVWEHAYYLQYQNERGKYVENWWNVVNWEAASVRYDSVAD